MCAFRFCVDANRKQAIVNCSSAVRSLRMKSMHPSVVTHHSTASRAYGRDCSISSSSCHKRRKLHHQPMSAASMRGTSTVSFCHMSRADKSTWHKGPSLSTETRTLCRYGNKLCVLGVLPESEVLSINTTGLAFKSIWKGKLTP